jgi:protein gp37
VADNTPIQWADATWNPVRGCTRVSPGCGGPNHEGGCYAEKIAARFSGPGQPYHGFAERTPHGGRWTGKLALIDSQLDLPLRWKRPRRIFVNSMSDLFHENLPDEAIDKVFAVMALAPQHIFQALTKRPERMHSYLASHDIGARWALAADKLRPGNMAPARVAVDWSNRGLPNVWLGVSVEDQARADERIPLLAQTPAALRFVSFEPLLSRVETPFLSMHLDEDGNWRKGGAIGWAIVGGESGHGARPMHPAWARSLRDQCTAAGVPYFFKQWGAWLPGENDHYSSHSREQSIAHWQDGGWGARKTLNPRENYVMWSADGTPHAGGSRGVGGDYFDVAAWASRVGKRAAGRLLDGRTWNQFPGDTKQRTTELYAHHSPEQRG